MRGWDERQQPGYTISATTSTSQCSSLCLSFSQEDIQRGRWAISLRIIFEEDMTVRLEERKKLGDRKKGKMEVAFIGRVNP
jgi:hypothetical protein